MNRASGSAIIMVVAATLTTSGYAPGSGGTPDKIRFLRLGMGGATEVQALDLGSFRRVVQPAYEAARRGEPQGLSALLREIAARLPASREDSVGGWRAQLSAANREVEAASAAHDSQRAKNAEWRLYEAMKDESLSPVLIRPELERDLAILDAGPSRNYSDVVELDALVLVDLLCTPEDPSLRRRLDVDSTGLGLYLQARSELFHDLYTGRIGRPIGSPSAWDDGRWLGHDDVRRLRDELRSLPAPTASGDVPYPDLAGRVRQQFLNLLETVLSDEKLVLTIGYRP